jgi:hypothetical protein
MNNKLVLAFAFTLFILTACKKSDPANEPSNPLIPSPAQNPPAGGAPVSDTSGAVKTSWKIYKDSLTNTGNYYFIEGGSALTPMPGVYWGVTGDYWNFMPSGNLSIHENNQTYSSVPYQFSDNTTLLIPNGGPIKKGKLISLSTTAATFLWKDTSANGGLYYRKLYLYK